MLTSEDQNLSVSLRFCKDGGDFEDPGLGWSGPSGAKNKIGGRKRKKARLRERRRLEIHLQPRAKDRSSIVASLCSR